jgi:hypothetical protein
MTVLYGCLPVAREERYNWHSSVPGLIDVSKLLLRVIDFEKRFDNIEAKIDQIARRYRSSKKNKDNITHA